MVPPVNTVLAELCGRVDVLVRQQPGRRVIVGVVGLPGSGKTTLADALVASLLQWHAEWTDHRTDRISDPDRPWIGSHVAHVPMDGFHLADVELNRLGCADRKGAPDTFDAAGYAALLQRLRHSRRRRVGASVRPHHRTTHRRQHSRPQTHPGGHHRGQLPPPRRPRMGPGAVPHRHRMVLRPRRGRPTATIDQPAHTVRKVSSRRGGLGQRPRSTATPN